MKASNATKSTLSNIRLINRRERQRNADAGEDSKLESAIIKEINAEFDSRIGSRNECSSSELIEACKNAGLTPWLQELAAEWEGVAIYCDAAADFFERRYGKGNEMYVRASERATTARECLEQMLTNLTEIKYIK